MAKQNPWIGKKLGGCCILSELGEGGMGTVYLAHHPDLDKKVAIKILSPAWMGKKKVVKRFLREAQMAASLDHPNIIPIYNMGNEAGVSYFTMQYIEGETLEDVLHKRGVLTEHETLRIAKETAKGLKAAHKKGIVHRDIKPTNIMISKDGQVKIADFGLAKTPESDLSTQGNILGTPHYIAPEQIEKKHPVDHRADLYALGITMYRCLTGKLPYYGNTSVQILFQQVTSPVPSVREINPDILPEIEQIVKKLMAKDPNERCSDAQEVLDEIDRCLELLGERGIDPSEKQMLLIEETIETPQTVMIRQNFKVKIFLFLAFVIIGSLGYILFLRDGSFAPQDKKTDYDTRDEKIQLIWNKYQEKLRNNEFREALELLSEVRKYAPERSLPDVERRENEIRDKINSSSNNQLNKEKESLTKAKEFASGRKYREALNELRPWIGKVQTADIFQSALEYKSKLYPEEITNSIGIPMILIHPGRFMMGSPEKSTNHRPDERQHEVRIASPFYIGKYELTMQQYKDLNPNYTLKFPDASTEHPVVYVSWIDAVLFSKRLSEIERVVYRLPTEAEWEYACRAGTNYEYSWGDQINSSFANYTWEEDWALNSRNHVPLKVGTYPPNFWKVYDMHGNVSEWTSSKYDYEYKGSEEESAPEDTKDPIVVRGGGWNERAVGLRAARRYSLLPQTSNAWVGFRIVREIPPEDYWLFIVIK